MIADALLVSSECVPAGQGSGSPLRRSGPYLLAFGLMLFAGLACLTLAFSTWTATSAFSFPRFLVALLFVIYWPGRFVIQALGLKLFSPL